MSTYAIEFTLDGSKAKTVTIDGVDYVEREAPLIFRSGNYPDKNFTMTPAELSQTVNQFKEPVHLGLEHIPTILDKRIGRLIELKHAGMDDKGNALMSGKALIPAWLDKVVPAGDRKLSAAFDRETKKLIGCDFVIKPRVSDAVMLAAFSTTPEAKKMKRDFATFASVKHPSAKKTAKGQKKIAKIHKMVAAFGATCRMPKKPATMSADDWDTYLGIEDDQKTAIFGSKDERKKLQHVHNVTSEGGSNCKFMPGDQTNDGNSPGHEPAKMSADEEKKASIAEFAACSKKSSMMTQHGQAAMKKVHDKAVKFGAKCVMCGEAHMSKAKAKIDELTALMNSCGGEAQFAAAYPKKMAKLKKWQGVVAMAATTDSEISIEEMGKIQRAHDVTAEDGWHCNIPSTPPKREVAASGPLTETQANDDKGISDLKALNDSGKTTSLPPTKAMTETQTNPADTGSQPSPSDGSPGFPPNSQFSTNGHRVTKFGGGDTTPTQPVQQTQQVQPMQTPADVALFNENVQLKAEAAAARKQIVERDAVIFADNELRENRIFPSEYDGLVQTYVQSALDDAKLNDTVIFSGAAMSRVDALKTRQMQRLPHNLTGETFPNKAKDGVQVLFSEPQKPNGQLSPQRQAELLGGTIFGRAIQKQLTQPNGTKN